MVIDPLLIDKSLVSEYLKFNFLPYRKLENGVIEFVSSSITPYLEKFLSSRYDEFIIKETAYKQMSSLLQTELLKENINYTKYGLYSNYNDKSVLSLPDFSGGFIAFLVTLLICFVLFPVSTVTSTILILNILYLMVNMFKCYIFYCGNLSVISSTDNERKKDIELPLYSVIVPLYKEEKILPQLIQSLCNIDYPEDKLDIKIAVEHDDIGTIGALKALNLDSRFNIIEVPDFEPRTKPKACTYALLFAKGEYVTIYDAEDIPDSLQLRKVLDVFANSDNNLACVQARLNYYNHDQNSLTRFFAIEYASLFNFMLKGLNYCGMPIPLGGTSNHFKTKILKKVYAWDPYNVTEDADLGIRLYSMGYTIELIDSYTMEEAPSEIWSWIKQRTRWLKGYLQTYLLYMNNLGDLYEVTGIKGVLLLQLFIGAPIITFLFAIFLWVLFFFQAFGYLPINVYLNYFALFNLISGLLIVMCQAHIAMKRSLWIKGSFLVPVLYPLYWLLHGVAAVRALWQFFTNQYYWEKTEHFGKDGIS